MFRGAGPFVYGMRTVRIFHKLKGLIILYQLIQQHFRIVEMHIVISARHGYTTDFPEVRMHR